MSLINKMLSDLEQRSSYRREQDTLVLGDLAPVLNTGFSSVRLPYHFMLVCFFLFALGFAVYSYRDTGLVQPAPEPQEPVMTPPTAEMVPDVSEPVAEPPALKLDLSLPAVSPVEAGGVLPASINMVAVRLQDRITGIELYLDREARYRVETSADPYAARIVIENAALNATVPDLLDHPYISGVRVEHTGQQEFSLVITTTVPVSIVNAGLTAMDGGYLLAVRLQADLPDTTVLLPPIEEVLDTSTSESGYGQMEIRPVSADVQASFGGMLNEARLAYARADTVNGDAILLAILEQDPLHVEARTTYAAALLERGNSAAAMQLLATGLELIPGRADWAMKYARLLVGVERIADAVNVLRRSLPAMDENEEYYAFYAALLQRVARHEEAATYYSSLLKRRPGNGLWWMGLAISLEGMRDSADALDAYKRAQASQSLAPELREYVGRQIERLGRL